MAAPDVRIREYQLSDRPAALALAPPLSEGVAAWRDHGDVLEALSGWVSDSLDRAAADYQAVFVAEGEGDVCGLVTVIERRHSTGALDAYVGELVAAERWARRGIGGLLMRRAERWSRSRVGLPDTGDPGRKRASARVLRGSGVPGRGRKTHQAAMTGGTPGAA